MNVYNSARMADVMAAVGYVIVEDAAAADLIILNTCHIREKAAEKVYSELGRLRRVKERAADAGRPVLLAVAGCVAQAEGAELVARAPLRRHRDRPAVVSAARRHGGARRSRGEPS